MAKVAIETAKIDGTKRIAHELEEASCLSDPVGRKLLAMAWHVDVEPGIEKFAKRLADTHTINAAGQDNVPVSPAVSTPLGRRESVQTVKIRR